MNSKYLSICTGVIAAGALAVSAIPAQAASFLGLSVLPTTTNLTRGQVASTSLFPHSAGTFTPTEDITVQFSVQGTNLGTRGRALSNFGFKTGTTFTPLISETISSNPGGNANNDWLGTAGVAIQGPATVTHTFLKGVTYQLGLLTGTKHSTFGLAQLHSYTFSKAADTRSASPVTASFFGSYILGFEDGDATVNGNAAYDYQDWVLTAKVVSSSVPEPATMVGLGLVGGMMALARRRKSNQPA